MKILVAIESGRERTRIGSVLAGEHHVVTEVAPAAADALIDDGFDVAFVDTALVGRVRAAPKRIYCVAVLAAGATTYRAAYEAGADDVMACTACDDEVLGTAAALARIRSWTVPQSLASRLSAISPWNRVDQIIGNELGDMIGDAFKASPFSERPVVIASEIVLTLAQEELQIRLGLAIDADAMTALQQTLLGGDTSEEALADAMREMANTAGGAIKRAALANGLQFTIGLPSNTNIVDLQRPDRRAFCLESPCGVSFICVALPTASSARLVAPGDLREGMILARDVHDGSGHLVATAGTNLTRTTVEHLARTADATTTFEVNDLAA